MPLPPVEGLFVGLGPIHSSFCLFPFLVPSVVRFCREVNTDNKKYICKSPVH